MTVQVLHSGLNARLLECTNEVVDCSGEPWVDDVVVVRITDVCSCADIVAAEFRKG